MKDEKQNTARTQLQISEKSVMQQLHCLSMRKLVAYGSKSKQVWK